jgi:hypothetical protein
MPLAKARSVETLRRVGLFGSSADPASSGLAAAAAFCHISVYIQ